MVSPFANPIDSSKLLLSLLNGAPEFGGFIVEAGLLQCVYCVPHEALQFLDLGLSFGYGSIVSRPLSE
jgi:hypothetical protein